MAAKKKPAVQESTEPKLTKNQVVHSETLGRYRDILTAILNDHETYTMKQAESLVSDFLKRKVRM